MIICSIVEQGQVNSCQGSRFSQNDLAPRHSFVVFVRSLILFFSHSRSCLLACLSVWWNFPARDFTSRHGRVTVTSQGGRQIFVLERTSIYWSWQQRRRRRRQKILIFSVVCRVSRRRSRIRKYGSTIVPSREEKEEHQASQGRKKKVKKKKNSRDCFAFWRDSFERSKAFWFGP